MAGDLPHEPDGASHLKRPAEVIRLGTCSWNFEDWRDVFYPDGLEGPAVRDEQRPLL